MILQQLCSFEFKSGQKKSSPTIIASHPEPVGDEQEQRMEASSLDPPIEGRSDVEQRAQYEHPEQECRYTVDIVGEDEDRTQDGLDDGLKLHHEERASGQPQLGRAAVYGTNPR